MIKAAKNKKAAIGLVLSAAICAFICGVTEPFEFGFMFLCFPLYIVYAALYGIFTVITYYVGFRAGFCFSAGATDLVFSSFLPAANNTLMIIPLGIAAFVVFYLVFYFAITKFNLKTPGREDEEADFAEVDKNAKLANNDFTAIAAAVLEGLGGKENVESLDNCITRLRHGSQGRHARQREEDQGCRRGWRNASVADRSSGYHWHQGPVRSRRNGKDAEVTLKAIQRSLKCSHTVWKYSRVGTPNG